MRKIYYTQFHHSITYLFLFLCIGNINALFPSNHCRCLTTHNLRYNSQKINDPTSLSLLHMTDSTSTADIIADKTNSASNDYQVKLPRVEFEYCTGCRWMLRSAYMAQEILTTFEKEIGEVALIPSKGVSGTFVVRVNGIEIWERKRNGGFPEIKEFKQLVRNIVSPDKSLGHSDTSSKVITL